MAKANDLTGRRFGRLVAVARSESTARGHATWMCRCDCGGGTVVMATNVLRGLTASCGCLQEKSRTKHGMCKTRTYGAWMGMKSRVSGNGDLSKKHYQGRGIKVASQWETSFEQFLADMGECPPGMELDRVDNDGDYEPGNCRWATRSQQMANTRRTHIVACLGESMCLLHACKKIGLSYRTAMKRMARGMSAQQAISI